MILHECIAYWLRRYGGAVPVGCAGLSRSVFQPPMGLLRWLFSPEAATELPRPLWAVAVAPGAHLPDGSALVWRGGTYRVLLSLEFRLDTTPIYRLLLIAFRA